MVTHRITVRGRRLSGVPFSVVQGCRSADALELDLDGDFDGAELVEVIVYPRDGSRAAESCVYDGGPVTLPDSAYEAPGWLGLAVLATKPGGDGRRFICRKNNVTTKPTEDSKSWEEQA